MSLDFTGKQQDRKAEVRSQRKAEPRIQNPGARIKGGDRFDRFSFLLNSGF
jgi:hypothetical protein